MLRVIGTTRDGFYTYGTTVETMEEAEFVAGAWLKSLSTNTDRVIVRDDAKPAGERVIAIMLREEETHG